MMPLDRPSQLALPIDEPVDHRQVPAQLLRPLEILPLGRLLQRAPEHLIQRIVVTIEEADDLVYHRPVAVADRGVDAGREALPEVQPHAGIAIASRGSE